MIEEKERKVSYALTLACVIAGYHVTLIPFTIIDKGLLMLRRQGFPELQEHISQYTQAVYRY
jgi:hypothetical protein